MGQTDCFDHGQKGMNQTLMRALPKYSIHIEPGLVVLLKPFATEIKRCVDRGCWARRGTFCCCCCFLSLFFRALFFFPKNKSSIREKTSNLDKVRYGWANGILHERTTQPIRWNATKKHQTTTTCLSVSVLRTRDREGRRSLTWARSVNSTVIRMKTVIEIFNQPSVVFMSSAVLLFMFLEV